MKLEHKIHYEPKEEFINALANTYKAEVKDVNSPTEVDEVIGPMVVHLSQEERWALGREFSRRMLEWDREHIPQQEFDNPWVGVAFYLDPLARQD